MHGTRLHLRCRGAGLVAAFPDFTNVFRVEWDARVVAEAGLPPVLPLVAGVASRRTGLVCGTASLCQPRPGLAEVRYQFPARRAGAGQVVVSLCLGGEMVDGFPLGVRVPGQAAPVGALAAPSAATNADRLGAVRCPFLVMAGGRHAMLGALSSLCHPGPALLHQWSLAADAAGGEWRAGPPTARSLLFPPPAVVMDCAASPTGGVWLSLGPARAVAQLSMQGTVLSCHPCPFDAGAVGVGGGMVVVAALAADDCTRRVVVLREDDGSVACGPWGTPGVCDGQVHVVQGVAVAMDGSLVALLPAACSLQQWVSLFTLAGKWLRRVADGFPLAPKAAFAGPGARLLLAADAAEPDRLWAFSSSTGQAVDTAVVHAGSTMVGLCVMPAQDGAVAAVAVSPPAQLHVAVWCARKRCAQPCMAMARGARDALDG